MKNNVLRLNEIINEDNNIPVSKKDNQINILMDKLANEWIEDAKKIPNPKPLFGSIMHEGEVGILFANTGKGKSTLAVQIATSIASGKETLGLETNKRKVIYFDFELSTKSFERRYTNENNESFDFPDNFIRVEIDRNKNHMDDTMTFEEMLIKSISTQVDKHKAEVVIIDNITFLSATNERSKEALELMKVILELSRKRNITVLLLAHTPKRDVYRPIQLEDLAGSKALSNFTDFVFCIGESIKGANIRYIKELKNRNFPIVFDENSVIACEVKKENNFLQFEFIKNTSEMEHLEKPNNDKVEEINKILALKEQGYTNVAIGEKLGVSEATVRRRIDNSNKM